MNEKYRIEYWETEECRDIGLGEEYFDDVPEDEEDAICLARKIYFKNDVVCVELVDNETGYGVCTIDSEGEEYRGEKRKFKEVTK